MKKNVMLIGFMGSGKTTVGIHLSYLLRTPVEDTDKLIESREHRSVSEIFAAQGEEYFRRLETALLEELRERKHPRIYSLGGGVPVRRENRLLLRQCGTVVYLRSLPETVYERVKEDRGRPLLQCPDPLGRIRELLSERSAAYEECADIILDTDGRPPAELAAEIAERVKRLRQTPDKTYSPESGGRKGERGQ